MLFGTRICLSMNTQEQRNELNKYKYTMDMLKTDDCVHTNKHILIYMCLVVHIIYSLTNLYT